MVGSPRSIRLTDNELAAIREAAAKLGSTSVHAFMRTALLHCARTVLGSAPGGKVGANQT
jgi:hypothetical protein